MIQVECNTADSRYHIVLLMWGYPARGSTIVLFIVHAASAFLALLGYLNHERCGGW